MPIPAITTDRQISALKPLSAVFEVAVRDCRGLYVRVFPTGTRNFELRYTSVGGARRRLGLGAWPELTLAQARIRAGEKRIAVLDGSDPAAERNQARLEARTGETFDQLAESYWAAAKRGLHGGRRRPKRASTIETERRWWDNHIKPKLGDRLYRDLKRRDIRLFMKELTDTTELAPASLASVGAIVQAILQYAVLEEKIESNPALGQARPLALTSRDRMFSDTALKVIWEAIESAIEAKPMGPLTGDAFNAISPTTGLALQFLLLTLTRRSEVAGAQWDEFDLQAGTWTIPAARAKALHIHVVPLTARMIEVLRQARQRHPTGSAVFPATRGEGGSMEPRILTRAVARICERYSLPRIATRFPPLRRDNPDRPLPREPYAGRPSSRSHHQGGCGGNERLRPLQLPARKTPGARDLGRSPGGPGRGRAEGSARPCILRQLDAALGLTSPWDDPGTAMADWRYRTPMYLWVCTLSRHFGWVRQYSMAAAVFAAWSGPSIGCSQNRSKSRFSNRSGMALA